MPRRKRISEDELLDDDVVEETEEVAAKTEGLGGQLRARIPGVELFSETSFQDVLQPGNPPGDALAQLWSSPQNPVQALGIQGLIKAGYWWVFDRMLAAGNITSTDVAVMAETLYEIRDSINEEILRSGLPKRLKDLAVIWHTIIADGIAMQLLVHASRSEKGWLMRILTGSPEARPTHPEEEKRKKTVLEMLGVG